METTCTTCRHSHTAPDNRLYCRRYPPTAHMVGSTQVGTHMTPLYDNVFPVVAAHLTCGEHRIRTEMLETNGNVTRLQSRGEEDGA